MTTRGIVRPTSIHFTIDGRHAAPRDMVRILLKRTFTDSILQRKELPPGMLLVDVRCGAILDALFRIFEGFYFGPHHLIIAYLIHFEEKLTSNTTPAASSPSTSAPSMPIPEAASTVSLDATPTSKPSITISALKFRALIQQHLGLLPPLQPDIPVYSEPPAPTEVTTPASDPTPAKDTHSRDPDPTTSGGPHRCLSFG
ncbi:hypothetical protein AAG906_019628 [Vitis piasezkii]